MSKRCRAQVRNWAAMFLVALLLVTSASCKKKLKTAPLPYEEAPEVEAPPPSMPQEEVEEAPIRPIREDEVSEEEIDETIRRQNANREFLRTVYFDFDRSEIRDDQASILQSNAAWLRSNPRYRVVIEGHCDERDTIEYNLALGDRRARTVRQYLIDLGIPADRMRTISYGEERPADPGHSEAAWAKNRRGEFTLEK